MKFCPKCGTRLKLKQIKLDKSSAITYVCDNCGFSDKAGKTVTQATEEELADAPIIKVVGEKEGKLTSLPDYEDGVPQVRTWRSDVVVPADQERRRATDPVLSVHEVQPHLAILLMKRSTSVERSEGRLPTLRGTS